jgi:hypothetical protein
MTMKLPILRRATDPAESPDRSALVPNGVRVVGWFWLAGVPVGFATGVMEFIQALQGGSLSIALPAGVGLSGWAIGRGLLRGNPRAWRWARRIAALAVAASLLVSSILLFADPDTVTLSFPWGARDAALWESVLLAGFVAVISGWQFLALNSRAAQAVYDPPAGVAGDDAHQHSAGE